MKHSQSAVTEHVTRKLHDQLVQHDDHW